MTSEETVGNEESKKPAPSPANGAAPESTTEAGPRPNPQEPVSSADSAEPGSPSDDTPADPLDFDQDRIVVDPIDEPDLDDGEPDPEAQLLVAQQKADENWERVLRMQADMENQRKRAQKDVENARKFALEGMINDLLPIRDSLEMGIAAAQETDADAAKIIEGSDLTLKMLAQAFEKYNISVIDPLDQKFDPEFHQAMSMQEVDGKEPNTVTAVLQKGYTLNDRLLRPALVMVAK